MVKLNISKSSGGFYLKQKILSKSSIKELRRSAKIQQIYPVIKAKDGEILDGFHRKKADPNWREEIIDVQDPKQKLWIKVNANIQRRTIEPEEKARWIQEARELLQKEGEKGTQEEIAKLLGLSQQWVAKWDPIEHEKHELLQRSNFIKHTTLWYYPFENGYGIEDYPGRLPPGIIKNLLYFFTKEGDLVLDPFAGGGVTIDVCKEMNRQYLAYDIEPARNDIQKRDINDGFGEKDNSVDFIFLDPPYWKRMKDKYTKQDTDLSQVSKEKYYSILENLAKECKRVLKPDGKVAIIVGNVCFKTEFEDIGFNCYQIFSKIFGYPIIRVVTNDPTIYQAVDAENFKKNRWFVGNFRDLMVFKK